MVSIKKRELLHLGVFVPKCNPDGSYSRVQCLKAMNVCWCVDHLGKEITGTRIIQGTPVCPCKFILPYICEALIIHPFRESLSPVESREKNEKKSGCEAGL